MTTSNGARGFPGGTVVKNPASTRDARDMDLIPGLRGSPGVENGNTLNYSYLNNPKDRGAWWATVCGVAKSWTCLRMFAHME